MIVALHEANTKLFEKTTYRRANTVPFICKQAKETFTARSFRSAATLLAALLLIPNSSQAQSSEWSFAKAVEEHGVVDIYFNPWSGIPSDEILNQISTVGPGLVNRVGFLYGGTSMKFYGNLKRLTDKIRTANPKVIVGGGFNEAIKKDYETDLDCGGKLGKVHFRAKELASSTAAGTEYRMIDLGTPIAQDFYICEGMIQLRLGIHFLHFEAPKLVVDASSNTTTALNAYKTVIATLSRYAAELKVPVYFSGDVFLAQQLPLSAVYEPSRFYHTTVPGLVQYQNKVAQPSIGVGYTYWLSEKIARDRRAETPQDTKVFFYIDNWDEGQDDLRRLMELDAANRHTLLTKSATVARQTGTYFIPSLTHCLGCVKKEHVGDKCELDSGQNTEYDASRCSDIPTIREALEIQRIHPN